LRRGSHAREREARRTIRPKMGLPQHPRPGDPEKPCWQGPPGGNSGKKNNQPHKRKAPSTAGKIKGERSSNPVGSKGKKDKWQTSPPANKPLEKNIRGLEKRKNPLPYNRVSGFVVRTRRNVFQGTRETDQEGQPGGREC